jgi:hypothetical protein
MSVDSSEMRNTILSWVRRLLYQFEIVCFTQNFQDSVSDLNDLFKTFTFHA